MNKYCELKIQITKEFTVHCSYIDSNKKEKNISLNSDLVGNTQEEENNKQFIEEWIKEPKEFKVYTVELFNKEYNVIAEVLFALLINQCKLQIEKDFIITKTVVDLPIQNAFFNSRMITSLDSIGLEKIELKDEEDIDYDYRKQGEIVQELLEKQKEYLKRKRMIEKVKEIKD